MTLHFNFRELATLIASCLVISCGTDSKSPLKNELSCSDYSDSQQVLTINSFTDNELKIKDALFNIDPYNAHETFIREPNGFMSFYKDGYSISVSLHEANHLLTRALTDCNQFSSFYLNERIFNTKIFESETPHIKIVESVYPPYLTNRGRYQLYIENHKTQSKSFHSLLNEFNAYVTNGKFLVKALADLNFSNEYGLKLFSSHDISGSLDFMLFFICYVKELRISYPNEYERILNSSSIEYLDVLWSEAENILMDLYPLIAYEKNEWYYSFFSIPDEIQPIDVLRVVYSEEYLSELDLLGIQHRQEFDWKDTFFSVKQ